LRTADAHALARLDFGTHAGDRPVGPVGHRLLQQGRDHAQRCLTLHRGRPRRDARLQCLDTAIGEIAAPQANRIFPHGECLGNLGAGPTSQRQQHRPRSIRLSAISGAGKSH
jgi:hypothetical protein